MANDQEKAEKEFRRWEEKLLARLRPQLSPTDLRDLLHPKNKRKTQDFIIAGYLTFPKWLARFDPKLQRDLTVNVNSYRHQRDAHQQSVLDQIDLIAGQHSGQALIDELGDTELSVTILPYVNWNKYSSALFPPMGMNAITQPIDAEMATEKGEPIMGRGGKPTGRVGTGGGDEGGSAVYISYSAHMWGSKGTAGERGPASNADEVLFHELIHAARMMRGISGYKPVDHGYENAEEYIAVVLSNIYLSEKKQKLFRRDHNHYLVLQRPDAFLDNPQHVNLSPRRLLEKFRDKQPTFFKALGRIGSERAPFNPVRDLDREPAPNRRR